jgi:hypothetical protein
LNSGRVIEGLPGVDFQELEAYVSYAKNYNIEFNYTLNPACMGNYEFSPQGVKEIKQLLRNLYNIGIEALTITMPSLFELVNSMAMKFRTKASAICEIMSPDKALFYQELGAERVVVDPDITRDFSRLKSICDIFSGEVEIIINNVCYKNCAYKMFHYNHEAHSTPENQNQTINDYYFHRCAMQKAKELKNIIRLNWIRPEDLKYYIETGVTVFKIQGRQNILTGNPVKAVEAYIKEDFHGNLYDLITIFAPYTAFQPYIHNKKLDGFIKTFFDNPGFCKNICTNCNYCESFAKKSLDLEQAENLNQQALSYFEGVDAYIQICNETTSKENNIKLNKKIFTPGKNSFDFE